MNPELGAERSAAMIPVFFWVSSFERARAGIPRADPSASSDRIFGEKPCGRVAQRLLRR